MDMQQFSNWSLFGAGRWSLSEVELVRDCQLHFKAKLKSKPHTILKLTSPNRTNTYKA